MIIQEILSDDVLIAKDNNKKDIIIYGNNIAKNTLIDEEVNTNKIERILKTEDSVEFKHLIDLIKETELEDFRIVNQVVNICEEELQRKIDFKLFITLSDHLIFALERLKKDINFSNKLLKEIKKYYPNEFEIGKKALSYLKTEHNLEMPEDEAGYIALHLANSKNDLQIPIAEITTQIVRLSLKTIEFINNIKLEENTIAYNRFIRHLKNCIQRAFSGKMAKEDDEVFFDLIREKYPKPYNTAKRISNYLYNQYSVILTEDEIINLTVHINQLLEVNNGRKNLL